MKLHPLPVGFSRPRSGLEGILEEVSTIVSLEEDDELQEFIDIIQSPTSHLSCKDLFWLASNSPEINTLFETNETLNREWAGRLEKLNNPNFPLVSMRGDNGVSVFTQFKGVYFWNAYKQLKARGQGDTADALGYIDSACQCGSYYALIEKLNGLQKTLEETGSRAVAAELVEWVDKLADTYWTAGLMNAGIYAMAVAGYYQDHNDSSRCSEALEAAVRGFLLAAHLEGHQNSVRITDLFYPENGWLDIMIDHPECSDCRNSNDVLNYLGRVLSENFGIDNLDLFLPSRSENARIEAESVCERYPSSAASLEMK